MKFNTEMINKQFLIVCEPHISFRTEEHASEIRSDSASFVHGLRFFSRLLKSS